MHGVHKPGGLFVVEDGLFGVADFFAASDAGGREFDVFGQEEEMPSPSSGRPG
jgi:hypothetical protein